MLVINFNWSASSKEKSLLSFLPPLTPDELFFLALQLQTSFFENPTLVS